MRYYNVTCYLQPFKNVYSAKWFYFKFYYRDADMFRNELASRLTNLHTEAAVSMTYSKGQG